MTQSEHVVSEIERIAKMDGLCTASKALLREAVKWQSGVDLGSFTVDLNTGESIDEQIAKGHDKSDGSSDESRSPFIWLGYILFIALLFALIFFAGCQQRAGVDPLSLIRTGDITP